MQQPPSSFSAKKKSILMYFTIDFVKHRFAQKVILFLDKKCKIEKFYRPWQSRKSIALILAQNLQVRQKQSFERKYCNHLSHIVI